MVRCNKVQKTDDQVLHTEAIVTAVRDLILEARRVASRAGYGKEILNTLAERLTAEFGRGFSRMNLAYMRKFYLLYRDRLPEKVQMASGKSRIR
jgi:hypothetical protein